MIVRMIRLTVVKYSYLKRAALAPKMPLRGLKSSCLKPPRAKMTLSFWAPSCAKRMEGAEEEECRVEATTARRNTDFRDIATGQSGD